MLTNLRTLDLRRNHLSDLPPEIAQLTSLRWLNLSSNQLTHLAAQVLPPYVQELDLRDNQLVSVPREIRYLTSLRSLDMSGNRLTALPPEIGFLTNLEMLNLRGNQLLTVPSEIGFLGNLKSFDLMSNNLVLLPPELSNLPETIDLRLADNDLIEPLPDVLARGVPALLTYLRGVLEAGVAQYEAKVLLVGEGNVGKTSLVAALRGESFILNRPTTHGIEIAELRLRHPELQQIDITLNTWDFGGQEVYRITHQFFFSRRCLYLLVWRPRDGQEENAIQAWCRRVHLRVGTQARVIIAATHAAERRPELDYPFLKRQFGNLLAGHYAVDNRTGVGIRRLRQAIAEETAKLPQMGGLISWRWIAAHNELRTRREAQISYQEFAKVCGRHELDEKQTLTLAGLLHDLGHIIHYSDDDGLRDVVVLQPEWLTKAIGYVLEDRDTENSGGVLDHHWLRSLWQNPDRDTHYDVGLHPYFLRLMEKFDVSYRIPDEDKSLVGQLVPYEEPTLPWQEDSPLPDDMRTLSLVCQMTEVAPGLIAWLTVRNHRFSTERHWRRGVFLEHRDHAAQALFALRDDRRLTLTVRAPSPDYFFSILRDSLEDLIRRRWKGLKYDLLVPCPQLLPDGKQCNGQFELQALQRHREREIPTVRCRRCIEEKNVSQLLTGFVLGDLPLRQVLEAVDERVERFSAKVDEQTEELLANQRQVAAYAADIAQQLRTLLRIVSTELPDCPRLFTLIPHEKTGRRRLEMWKDYYRLTLWCEHPGQEHPWTPAQYEFARPKQWLEAIGPYALMVSRLLHAAIPIGGAILDTIMSEQELKEIRQDLEMMELLAKQPQDSEYEGILSILGEDAMRSVEGAGLRALRAMLVEVDPTMTFGDLRRVLAPSGDFLWVCPVPEHLRVYDPGLPELPD
jgi:internalin A